MPRVSSSAVESSGSYRIREHFADVPEGSVSAIDNDPHMIELAERRLSGRESLEVRAGSVTATGFPDATFDAATARLVFQHLPDP